MSFEKSRAKDRPSTYAQPCQNGRGLTFSLTCLLRPFWPSLPSFAMSGCLTVGIVMHLRQRLALGLAVVGAFTVLFGEASAQNIKLNDVLTPGGNVVKAISAPDGGRVVYLADQNTDQVFELFSAPVRGTTPIPDAGVVVRLNGQLDAGGNVSSSFAISPDGTRVVYVANQDSASVFELYSVPIAGGSSVKLISGVLQDECVELFREWRDKGGRAY